MSIGYHIVITQGSWLVVTGKENWSIQKGRIPLGIELAYAVLIFLFHAIYCIRPEDFSVDR